MWEKDISYPIIRGKKEKTDLVFVLDTILHDKRNLIRERFLKGLEKVYVVHRCLSLNRHGVTSSRLRQVAGCSEQTLFRILRFMRGELGAPIPPKPPNGLYRYEEGTCYELPGIWLKGEELVSLTELASRLEELQAEFLTGSYLRPFVEKLESLLEDRKVPLARMNHKVLFLPMRMRKIDGVIFRTVMEALFDGRKVYIRHEDRSTGTITERSVSPQKMIRYRDNWYLDAYCHLRDDLRSFSLSGILEVHKSSEKTRVVPERDLQDHFASAYGIFGGKADKTADILLTGLAARMAGQEPWHSREERETLAGGALKLRIPYRDSRELLGDILRFGEEAEVLGPPELRDQLIKKLKKVSKKYPEN